MSENKVKQILVMRTDLNMRKGKMIAQGAHSSIAFMTNRIATHVPSTRQGYIVEAFLISAAEQAWIEGRFTKICVRVDSEEELLDIHAKAVEAGIVCHLIQDAGLTEFGGVATYTCCALGPDYAEKLDPITGDLTLL